MQILKKHISQLDNMYRTSTGTKTESEVKGGIPNLRKGGSSSLTRIDSILIFQEQQQEVNIKRAS